MTNTTKKTTIALAASAALSAGLALSPMMASADTNPFASAELSSGYMHVAEATCGANKEVKKDAEAKCGADKAAAADAHKATKEGKCGEAKCGAEKKAQEAKMKAEMEAGDTGIKK